MRDLLRRVQEALPPMTRWIDRIHAEHASRAIPALGAAEFLSTYAVGLAQRAYETSPLESVAFWLEGQFDLGIAPLDVSGFVAKHALAARDAAARVFRKHHLQLGA
jgi:hypothetical protein